MNELVKGSKWPITGDRNSTKHSLSHAFHNQVMIDNRKVTVAMNAWGCKSDAMQLKLRCELWFELSQRNNYKYPIYKK